MGWSAAHEGLGRLSVYRSCRLAVFVAGVCLILKQAHCSRASFVFARSLDRAAWISLAECCCFRDEQLGWTSLSTNRPTASFLSMCVMDGRVLAQEDSKCLRVAFRHPARPHIL